MLHLWLIGQSHFTYWYVRIFRKYCKVWISSIWKAVKQRWAKFFEGAIFHLFKFLFEEIVCDCWYHYATGVGRVFWVWEVLRSEKVVLKSCRLRTCFGTKHISRKSEKSVLITSYGIVWALKQGRLLTFQILESCKDLPFLEILETSMKAFILL